MDGNLSESEIEMAGLAWLKSLGWAVKHGPEITPDALLPKLISGGLRVPDVEKILEGAT